MCRRDYCCISYSIQTLLHHSPSKVCQVLASFCGARQGVDKHPTDLALLIQQLPRCLKELEEYLDVCNILGGLTDVGSAPTISIWTFIGLWETLLCWKSKSCTCGWESLIKFYDSVRCQFSLDYWFSIHFCFKFFDQTYFKSRFIGEAYVWCPLFHQLLLQLNLIIGMYVCCRIKMISRVLLEQRVAIAFFLFSYQTPVLDLMYLCS